MFRKASYVDETKLRFRYNTGKKKLFSHMTNLQTYYHLQLDFQKVDQHTGGQVVNPRHQTPQGQPFAKPGTPL